MLSYQEFGGEYPSTKEVKRFLAERERRVWVWVWGLGSGVMGSWASGMMYGEKAGGEEVEGGVEFMVLWTIGIFLSYEQKIVLLSLRFTCLCLFFLDILLIIFIS